MNSLERRGVERGRSELAEEIKRIAANEELSSSDVLRIILEEVNKSATFCGYTTQRGY